MTAPHELTLADAGALIAARHLSPVELLADCRARIAEVNPLVDAFIRTTFDEAEASARNAESEIIRNGPRSPLHGIPIGLKDIIDLEGHPTTCHSRLRIGHVAAADAAVVGLLRTAGVVFPGKLATHEFAIGGPAFDLPFPPARNPWNRMHHPGGSSSGSGAAVAARMMPAALGTDTGGSVRHPASHCGIVGLKATYGLVPRDGVFPLAFSLDHVGPLTRTVRDAALMLNCMSGGREEYQRDLGLGLRGLRVGFVRHFHETDMPADVEMGAAIEAAAELLSKEGAQVRTINLAPLDDFAAVNRTVLYGESSVVHEAWLRHRADEYAAVTRRRLLPGLFLPAVDFMHAARRRTQLVALVEAAFGEVDVLLTASSMDPACRIDDTSTVERTYPRQARTPLNVTGHPAITLMAGLSSGGLPLSVQFVAPSFCEAMLLRAAHAFERAGPWKDMAPPLHA